MSTKSSPLRSVALIAGPTASGKSAMALDLADAWVKARKAKARIINADSIQVYSDIPILSAAPNAEEQSRHEHRLYGAWDGAEACSAADWAARAKAEITEAHEAGELPILVGGTGMYLKVLLEGIAPIPAIDPEIRSVVREMPTERAYAALMIEDPERATQLDPRDSQRIARALEVKKSTGVTLGDWQRAKSGGIAEEIDLHAAILLPERQLVYDRCDTRFVAMLEAGAIDEVEKLVKRKLSPEMPVMRAIGVPEILTFLARTISHDEMTAAGQQSTRNYAKRQFTWFRNQSPEEWPRVESKNISVEDTFASLLRD